MNNYAIVLEDDSHTADALSRIIQSHGYQVDTAGSIEAARKLFTAKKPNLMFVDVMLPDGNGVDLIEELQGDPAVKFVVVTGNVSVKVAIQSLKAHVYDFLEKPFELAEVRELLKKQATSYIHTEQKVSSTDYAAPVLLGESPVIDELRKEIENVAKTSASVFLQGESGSGKEIVAQHIHSQSGRQGKFVAVNCGSVSKELAASELFGHEKGSFTGANQRHIGHFENANGGTILLDEITEMALDTQVHLLRVLETSKLRRLGGKDEIDLDVRVIAATNRSFQEAIDEGKLREDLYFRLAEFPINIPPLRNRGKDILLIADETLKELNVKYNTNKAFTEETRDSLLQYPWPGNVRELKNILHRAFLISGDELDWKNIFSNNSNESTNDNNNTFTVSDLIGKTFWQVEKELIFATLKHHDDDKEQAAKTLGISLKTLYNRLHAYS